MNSAAAKLVLYIEDNPVNVCLVQFIFDARPNATLLVAGNGGDGLAAARAHHPDLILLDLNLPDMDGEEFLRQLRAEETLAQTPIVILSADALEDQQRRLADMGIADYVTKPLDVAQFEQVVERYFT